MEYENIKEQKLKQLKEQAEQQQKESDAEMQLNEALKMLLEPEAKARLSNVKLVNKELYIKAAQFLLYMVKSGKVKGKIDEQQLKELLKKLSEKREMQIKRK